MQIVSLGDNLHEVSDPISLGDNLHEVSAPRKQELTLHANCLLRRQFA